MPPGPEAENTAQANLGGGRITLSFTKAGFIIDAPTLAGAQANNDRNNQHDHDQWTAKHDRNILQVETYKHRIIRQICVSKAPAYQNESFAADQCVVLPDSRSSECKDRSNKQCDCKNGIG